MGEDECETHPSKRSDLVCEARAPMFLSCVRPPEPPPGSHCGALSSAGDVWSTLARRNFDPGSARQERKSACACDAWRKLGNVTSMGKRGVFT